ncbi:unnamed protein product [marine sediment metagenome]|uniref:Uncharacterized protein n=1 Tax=marine sediment metagenome TaxID=412755 RepID=X1NKH0_9ZZZZ
MSKDFDQCLCEKYPAIAPITFPRIQASKVEVSNKPIVQGKYVLSNWDTEVGYWKKEGPKSKVKMRRHIETY